MLLGEADTSDIEDRCACTCCPHYLSQYALHRPLKGNIRLTSALKGETSKIKQRRRIPPLDDLFLCQNTVFSDSIPGVRRVESKGETALHSIVHHRIHPEAMAPHTRLFSYCWCFAPNTYG